VGYTLLGAANQTFQSSTPGDFHAFQGQGHTLGFTGYQQPTEALVASPMLYAAQTFGLSIYSQNDVVQLRKNGANANQIANSSGLPAPQQDSFAQGDLIALNWVSGANIWRAQMIVSWTGAGSHGAVYGVPSDGTAYATGTRYFPFAGGQIGSVIASTFTGAAQGQKLGQGGSVSRLGCTVQSNTTTAQSGLNVIRTSGASISALFGLAINAGLTGAFAVYNQSASVLAGDLIGAQLIVGAGGSVVPGWAGFGMSSLPGSNDLWASTAGVPASTTAYFQIYGYSWQGVGPEANGQISHGFGVTISGLTTYISQNPTTVAATLTLRKNAANANGLVVVGAGLTGWFTDTGHRDFCLSTDLVNTMLVTGAGGLIAPLLIGVTETPATTSGNALMAAALGGYATPVQGTYGPFFGACQLSSNAAEGFFQTAMPVAGVLSRFTVAQGAYSGALTCQLRKNNANAAESWNTGNPTLTSPSSDSFAVGDLIGLNWTAAGGTVQRVQAQLATTGTHGAVYGSTSGGSVLNGVVYMRLWGSLGGATSLAPSPQVKALTAGMVQRMSVTIGNSATTALSSAAFNKNGAVANQTISIGAGLTGVFTDTANLDWLAVGDLYCLQVNIGAGGMGIPAASVGFLNLDTPSHDLWAVTGSAVAAGGIVYYSLYGNQSAAGSGSDVAARIAHGYPCSLSGMTIYVSANATTAATGLYSRKEAVIYGNQRINIGAGLTGWFQDTVNSDGLSATDLANTILMVGAGGALTSYLIGFKETAPAVSPPLAGFALQGMSNQNFNYAPSSGYVIPLFGHGYNAYQTSVNWQYSPPMPVSFRASLLAAPNSTGTWGMAGQQNIVPVNAPLANQTTPVATNTLDLTAGDNFGISQSNSGAAVPQVQMAIQGFGNYVQVYGAAGSLSLTAATTYYSAFSGGLVGQTAAPALTVDQRVGSPGAMTGLTVTIVSNATTAASTVNFWKNGAAGTQTLTVGAGLTGSFQATYPGVDLVSVGDTYCAQVVVGAGGALGLYCLLVGFVNNAAPSGELWENFGGGNTGQWNLCPYGAGYFSGTGAASIPLNFPGVYSGLTASVSANVTTSASTITMYKNLVGVANGLATIGAGLTGWFTDTTNRDVAHPLDPFCTQLNVGAGGAGVINVQRIGITLSAPTYPVGNTQIAMAYTPGSSNVEQGVASFCFVGASLPAVQGFSGQPTQLPVPFAFTCSGLSAAQGPQSGVWAATLRKNGVNVGQTISPSNLTDTTHIDTFVAGDLIDLNMNPGNGAYLTSITMQMRINGFTHGAVYGATGPVSLSITSAVGWITRLHGNLDGVSTAYGNDEAKAGVAGTTQGLAMAVISSTTSVAQVFFLDINASNYTQTFTVGAGLSGVFRDTTHTDPLHVGDLYCLGCNVVAGTGSIYISAAMVGFLNPVSAANDLYVSIYGTVGAGSAAFAAPFGACSLSTTEQPVQLSFGFACVLANLAIYVSANAATTTCSAASRVNGATGQQLAMIGTGLTGWFTDKVNYDSYAPTDYADTLVMNGGGGGMTPAMIGYVQKAPQPYVGTLAVSEAGAAAETTNRVANLLAPISEFGVASDTEDGHTFIPQTVGEAGAATDTMDVGAYYPRVVNEVGAALDRPDLMNHLALVITETNPPAQETVDARFAPLRASVAEVGGATDLTDIQAQFADAVVEAGAGAIETMTIYPVIPVTVAETGNAQDTIDAYYRLFGQVSETGAAADLTDALVASWNVIAEAGAALDQPDGVMAMFGVKIATGGNAQDAQDTTASFTRAIMETVSATDFPAAAIQATVTIAESGSATDYPSLAGFHIVGIIEAGNAQDQLVDASLIIVGVIAEAGAAADVVDAPAAFLGVAIRETGAAADSPDMTVPTYRVQVTEIGSAADITNSLRTLLGVIAEQGVAVDAPDARHALLAVIQEIGHALDQTFPLGFKAYAQVLTMTARIIHAPPPP
jgi:hypothetical protein